MRMGIGIGWPNSSAGNQPQMVYFEIFRLCGEVTFPPGSTQLVNSSLYQTDDFVNFDNGGGDVGRVRLGDIVESEGSTIYNISGPIYVDCN